MCVLTVTSHILIYRKIKYKDDGRDLVTWVDYITIHVTFPFINAWVSYQLLYMISLSIVTACPFMTEDDAKFDELSHYC